jgi:hypothetical protein
MPANQPLNQHPLPHDLRQILAASGGVFPNLERDVDVLVIPPPPSVPDGEPPIIRQVGGSQPHT